MALEQPGATWSNHKAKIIAKDLQHSAIGRRHDNLWRELVEVGEPYCSQRERIGRGRKGGVRNGDHCETSRIGGSQPVGGVLDRHGPIRPDP